MSKTRRGKFEGGDATWEESRLGSYKDSEIRLVEIQEQLCEDLSSYKDNCHQLAEDTEPIVENWWFKLKNKDVSLFSHLCVNERKVCCDYNHFGSECTKCEENSGKFCNDRGTCNGNGTRTGTGNCDCYYGYTGKSCNECSSGFYLKQSDPLTCLACDTSCLDNCKFKGPKGCISCKSGYNWDDEKGCIDVNECTESFTSPCPNSKFCINNLGSYICSGKLLLLLLL